MATKQIALVLGATGGIGGEVACKLKIRGWTVRTLLRDPQRLATDKNPSWNWWVQGDAMSARDVVAAAEGASLIVHAVNPPGYRNWGELVLPMLNNTIAAAHATGARILMPGTVYNYGPDAFPTLDETSPQNPITRKGKIRAEMERRLRAATAEGAKVIIVRAGDFFGPRAGNNWFSQGLIQPGRPITAITYPGRRGVGHQWGYLPDVAETMVQLVEKADTLEPFATFHMNGHWDGDGTQMIGAILDAVGNPSLKVRKLPWAAIGLASPFVPLFRELWEMRYLWQMPVRMTNERLVRTLGTEPHTSLHIAVHRTLLGLGCLSGHANVYEQDLIPGE